MPQHEVTSIETARAIVAELRKKQAEREDLAVVASLGEDDLEKIRTEAKLSVIRGRLERRGYLNGARPSPRAAKRRLEELAEQIETLEPQLQAARQIIETDKRRRAGEAARQLAPRHRAAVAAMLEAVEALSVAIDQEELARRELHAATSMVDHPLVPFMALCGGGLGSLAARDTPLATWARAARRYLDGSAR